MKWIKRLLLFIVIIFILALIAGIIVLKNFDVADYKDVIEEKITAQLDRDVAIEDIALQFSFSDGLHFQLEGLSIKEEPARRNDFLMRVERAELGVDAMAFIRKREIKVSEVSIIGPEIYLVRDADGTLNIDDVAPKDQSKPGPVKESQESKSAPKAGEKKEEINISVNTVKITGAKLYFFDEVPPGREIKIHSMDLSVDKFTLNENFDFNLQFGLLHAKANVFINGTALVNPADEQVILKSAKITTDLAAIDLVELSKLMPENEEIKKLERIKGNLKVELKDLIYAKGKAPQLQADINFSDGTVKVTDLDQPIEQIKLIARVSQSKLKVEDLSFYYGKGSGRVESTIENYLLAPTGEFDVLLDNFRAEEILSSFKLPIEVEGTIDGKFKGQAQGMTAQALEKTLLSTGRLDMTEGLLKDINVLKMVLSKLSYIPNLAERIEEKLPPTYKEKLKAKDTIINLVESDLNVNGGKLYFRNTKVDADGFILDLSGDMDFNQTLNLSASFSIPFELSQLMVTAVPDLSVLLDGDNIIRIPLKPYKGKLDKFMIYPDIGDVAQRVMKSRGKQELQNLIFKALDIDEESQPQEGGEQLQETPDGEVPAETKPPEQEAIENVLDMIFQ